jgi:hypothetical protein
LTAKAGKVSTSWGNTDVSTLKLLVDTYSDNNNSTYLKETFIDEEFRLLDTTDFDNGGEIIETVGDWDSTLLLTEKNAQQFLGNLQVAKDNYSEYGVEVDYTSFQNDDQIYYRPMYAVNKPNSNGTLKIYTKATIGNDYEVFIKFPTITGWLDITKLYDVQDFSNNKTVDGTGCAVNINKKSTSFEVDWTIGTNSTNDSNFLYVVKIILKNKNTIINEIAEISNNWS